MAWYDNNSDWFARQNTDWFTNNAATISRFANTPGYSLYRGSGNLYGAAPQGGSGAYGAVPVAPDPTTTTRNAITGNITNMPFLERLASQINEFQQGQLLDNFRRANPLFDDNLRSSSENISANLRGELHPDIVRQFQVDAAERGVSMGAPGSPNVDTNYLMRVLRERLARQDLGQTQYNESLRRPTVVQPFNVADFLTTPSDQWNATWLANQLASAPNPALAAEALRNATRSGVNYGAGIGGGGARIDRGFGGGTNTGAGDSTAQDIFTRYSTGGGTNIGGTTYYGNDTPGSASANWNAWNASMPWNNPVLNPGPSEDFINEVGDYYGQYEDLGTPADFSSNYYDLGSGVDWGTPYDG